MDMYVSRAEYNDMVALVAASKAELNDPEIYEFSDHARKTLESMFGEKLYEEIRSGGNLETLLQELLPLLKVCGQGD